MLAWWEVQVVGRCPIFGAVPVVVRASRVFVVTVAVRVIPCLDVHGGRVVKGVNFVELRDAGDPVELGAVYDAEGPTS